MTRGLAVLFVSGLALACASSGARRGTRLAPDSIALFRLDDDLGLGCTELGLLAESDGAMNVSSDCSCSHPPPRSGTESGALERIRRAASDLGANAVWVLRVFEQSGLITHRECCNVTGFRAYGVAFRCDDSQLSWHQKHESVAKQ